MIDCVAYFKSHQKNARKRYFEKSGEDILSDLISKRPKFVESRVQNGKEMEENYKTFAQALEKSA